MHKIFSSHNLLSTIKSADKLDCKKGEIERITSLLHLHKANFSDALTHALSAIRIYEEHEEVTDSSIISELLYQTALIYH